MYSTRLINPTAATINEVVNATVTLLNATAPLGTGITEKVKAESVIKQAAGVVQLSGAIEENQTGRVGAVTVAWFTRLDGVKVVRVFGAVVKYNELGLVDYPATIKNGFQDQMIASGGYCVLAAERLALGMQVFMKHAEKATEYAAVLDQPGDLNVWKAAIDVLAQFNPEAAAELRDCIGAK